MSALEELIARYEDPRPASGAGLVGYLGADVPRELVEAAGMLPVRLRGDGPPSPLAEEILGPRVDPPVRRVLAALLEGALPVDFLLLAHDSDSSVRLYTSLRVLATSQPLPQVWFLDLLHLPTGTTARYDLDRLRELQSVLGCWAGRPVTDERIGDAIREANRTRRLLGQVAELRRASPPLLWGAQALAVIGASTALPAAEYNDLLEALLAEGGVECPTGRRVYLTGSGHGSAELYREVESDGSIVVGEDHDWGESLADGLVDEDGDPIAALAVRYGSGSALARRHRTNERAEHTAREAEAAAADVVLSWVHTGDDALAWGLPAQRRLLESRGLPFVVLEHRGLEAEAVALP